MHTDARKLHALLKELQTKQEPVWLLTELYAVLSEECTIGHPLDLFEVFRAHLERLELVPGCTWQRQRLMYFEEFVGLMFRFVSDHGRHLETERVRKATALWLEDIERHVALHPSVSPEVRGLARQALVRAREHLTLRSNAY